MATITLRIKGDADQALEALRKLDVGIEQIDESTDEVTNSLDRIDKRGAESFDSMGEAVNKLESSLTATLGRIDFYISQAKRIVDVGNKMTEVYAGTGEEVDDFASRLIILADQANKGTTRLTAGGFAARGFGKALSLILPRVLDHSEAMREGTKAIEELNSETQVMTGLLSPAERALQELDEQAAAAAEGLEELAKEEEALGKVAAKAAAAQAKAAAKAAAATKKATESQIQDLESLSDALEDASEKATDSFQGIIDANEALKRAQGGGAEADTSGQEELLRLEEELQDIRSQPRSDLDDVNKEAKLLEEIAKLRGEETAAIKDSGAAAEEVARARVELGDAVKRAIDDSKDSVEDLADSLSGPTLAGLNGLIQGLEDSAAAGALTGSELVQFQQSFTAALADANAETQRATAALQEQAAAQEKAKDAGSKTKIVFDEVEQTYRQVTDATTGVTGAHGELVDETEAATAAQKALGEAATGSGDSLVAAAETAEEAAKTNVETTKEWSKALDDVIARYDTIIEKNIELNIVAGT